MNEAYLFGFRCGVCAEYVEIAATEPPRKLPTCVRCNLRMDRQGASDVAVPAGIGSFRSSNCQGCGERIKLEPITTWQPFCVDCRAGQAEHRSLGAEHDWLPSDPKRADLARQLLTF